MGKPQEEIVCGSLITFRRGQKCDALYLDEMDYMAEADFDTISTIAAERPDITVFASSTPTGARKKFYQCCTDKSLGYTEFHFPSTCNPNWCAEMEAEFRSQLSEQGYVHEIMAEFGTEEAGVFDKVALDEAMRHEYYTYNPLDYIQNERCKLQKYYPDQIIYDENNVAPFNPWRCIGVDFDKYQASSSILVLDYIPEIGKYKVFKRVELPRAEYSYDNALNTIIRMNAIYNPSWIYCDRGEGEYIIERLHIYGDEHPETGLHLKVKGWRFSNNVTVMDPVMKKMVDKPMKPFMVNQLSISIERRKLILSPFDETLHKQLVDYSVERIGKNGPVFSSVNEHFVDALGLAHLAFILEFPELSGVIKEIEQTSDVKQTSNTAQQKSLNKLFESIKNPYAVGVKNRNDDDDLPGDKPPNYTVYHGSGLSIPSRSMNKNWGSRNVFKNKHKNLRNMW